MLFSKANLMVGGVAAKDAKDPLHCIRLNPDGSTVAANGKVVMAVGPMERKRVHFPSVGEEVTPEGSGVSIPLDLLDKVVKNLPKDKRTDLQNAVMTYCAEPGKVELTTSDTRHTQRIAGFPNKGGFPEWRGSLRKLRGSGGTKICVNRKTLLELLTALEEACPDKGDENQMYIEINPESTGMVLRCVNRETGQRAIGGVIAYNTDGHWLPCDQWEQGVFQAVVKRALPANS